MVRVRGKFLQFLARISFENFANTLKCLILRLFKCAARKSTKLNVRVQYWKAHKPVQGQGQY